MNFKEYLEKTQNQKERKIALKQLRSDLEKDNKKYPDKDFVSLPVPDKFVDNPKAPFKIFRSRYYLVQLYVDNDHVRISVNRTDIDDNGEWLSGISWDTLQNIKNKVGYGDYDAVEVYPKNADVINVANIRHLFILKESLPFLWKNK